MAFWKVKRVKKKNGAVYEYRELVESFRIPGLRTPRHRRLRRSADLFCDLSWHERMQEEDDRAERAVAYAVRAWERQLARAKKEAPAQTGAPVTTPASETEPPKSEPIVEAVSAPSGPEPS